MLGSSLQRIEEVMVKSNDAKVNIAEFVLKERKELHKYTIARIAEETYTSKATVVRFAKALGYEGWKDFMVDFEKELQYEEKHRKDIDANYPFSGNDGIQQIVQNILQLQMESLQDTADNFDYVQLKKAADLLVNARRIVIYGFSPHVYCGQLFCRKMMTIGKDADCCRPGETGLMTRNLTKDDCAIIISYAGNNKNVDPMQRIPLLKRQGVPLIGITSGGDNYIRRTADIVFSMSTKERLYSKIANYSTEESVNFILNVLFSCCFARNYNKNLQFKVHNAEALEKERYTEIQNIKEK
ncbi:MAG: MurR/RpiR family transcriptional regulator [Lachnospiraceae bacterium]|nr:MurR/RpiR family transcriptional regulator [Lachnospiraceae bacterium]MDY4969764.1 MurR/RpiR family transcriptional regulator [Lachnospiraceae bacterium]